MQIYLKECIFDSERDGGLHEALSITLALSHYLSMINLTSILRLNLTDPTEPPSPAKKSLVASQWDVVVAAAMVSMKGIGGVTGCVTREMSSATKIIRTMRAVCG